MKITQFYEYFLNDPLRLLYLTGGTGGIWYWMRQWRDRTRVRIKIVEESRYIKPDMQYIPYIVCEAENIGARATSLDECVLLTGYTPSKAFVWYDGKVTENDRKLSPHEPKKFTVDFPDDVYYESLLFRTYKFRLTRGFSKTLRFWSAFRKPIKFFNFHYQVILFKHFNQFNEGGSSAKH